MATQAIRLRERRAILGQIKAKLEGQTALVTGGSRGIGRAIVLALANNGAAVVANYHANQAAAQQVVQDVDRIGGKAWAVQADVSSKADVQRLFQSVRKHMGERLDILINNAGSPTQRFPLAQMPEEVWDHCFAVNVKSAFLCSQAAWDLLPDSSGRVINVTSISARSGGGPGMSHYASSKAAMTNFTRAAAKEFAPRGITVNGVAPGVIFTDLHKNETPEQEIDEIKDKILLGRLGEAEDIAGAVLLLCSEGGSYITGEIIEINGGLLMS